MPRTLELEGEDVSVAREVADALVRVGREAVANAEQHSGCDRVGVRVVTLSPAVVTLRITDDGTYSDAAPALAVVMFSAYSEPPAKAIAAGAAGYMLKERR